MPCLERRKSRASLSGDFGVAGGEVQPDVWVVQRRCQADGDAAYRIGDLLDSVKVHCRGIGDVHAGEALDRFGHASQAASTKRFVERLGGHGGVGLPRLLGLHSSGEG